MLRRIKNIICNLNNSLQNIKVNSQGDVLNIATIINNPYLKIYTIVYMKDSNVVGYECLTVKIPSILNYFNHKVKVTYLKQINQIAINMYMLGANSYYIACCYPQSNPKMWITDSQIVKKLSKDILGLKGYLKIGTESYSYISTYRNKLVIESKNKLDGFIGINFKRESEKNPNLKVKINSKIDIVNLITSLDNISDCSILVLTDKKGEITFIQKVLNSFITMSYKQINKQIRDKKDMTQSSNAYFITTDKFFYSRAFDLMKLGVVKNTIAYIKIGGKYKILKFKKLIRLNKAMSLSKRKDIKNEI